MPNNHRKKGIRFAGPLHIKNHGKPITLIQLTNQKALTAVYELTIVGNDNNVYNMLSKDDVSNLISYTDELNYNWSVSKKNRLFFISNEHNIFHRRFKEKNIDKIFKIYKSNDNKIWVGTSNGLFNFNTETESLVQDSTIPNLNNHIIVDIIETNDNTLFFATKNHGVFLKKNDDTDLNPNNQFLTKETINHLIYDSLNNQIWAGTKTGVLKLSLDSTNNWYSNSLVNKYDGIKNTDIRQISILGNHLFLASNNAIHKIKRNQTINTLPTPFLHIDSVYTNGSKYSKQTRYQFRYDSNNIQIEYQGISYKSQNDIIYKYKLLPITTKWQSTTNTNISFNALPPNQYTLIIKAINIDGVESEIKSIQFDIIPAFWMTWWFKIIVIVIAVTIGYRLSIRTIQAYKSQAELQKSLNEMQIMSLQAKMNPHFIFNSLNSIQNYILKNDKLEANQYLLEFSRLIRTTLKNSNSSTITLKQELETLKMYVNLEKKRIRKEFEYNTIVDSSINPDLCIIPSLLIQPYIENAIWHGKIYANNLGKIILDIRRSNNILFFKISDNGIGIKNAEQSKINQSTHQSYGTSVTKKRIQLLSELNSKLSDVKITEHNNNADIYVGTVIEFHIPYITKKDLK